MPNFKIITVNSNDNALKWVDSADFKSANRIVDEKGKAPSSNYTGARYQIISKKQRDLSYLERSGRGFLGTLAVAGSLGLGLFFKPVRNLLIKQKTSIRFAVPVLSASSQKPKTSKEELQQGISVPEQIVSKIQTCMENILQRKEKDGIKFYDSQENHRIFELNTAPGLIFKMDCPSIKDSPIKKRYQNMIHAKTAPGLIFKTDNPSIKDSPIKKRYQNMIQAQKIILAHQLGLLVIPHAKLFTVDIEDREYEIIAEEKMDINPFESAQEEYFQTYADSLNETIRQLAVFICMTGYSDVEWRNNPILNNSLDEKGNRKIALVDIEEMRSSTDGLFGEIFGRRGLVKCINEEQGKIVEIVAKKSGVSTFYFEYAHSQRKKELEEAPRLKEYYARKKIILGNEPIQVDENILSFSTDPKKEKILKKLTLKLIEEMNTRISTTSEEEPIKGRRYVYINTNRGAFQGMDRRLVDPGENECKIDEEYHNATFLGCVVKKLKDLGVIYKFVKRNGHGYFIQA